jgi:hypothetical protein
MNPGENRPGSPRNQLKTLETDFGGRDRLDFGTVRPRVQIPGPRPYLYSKSTISEVARCQRHTAGSQFPAEHQNCGGITVLVVGQCEIAGQRPVPRQQARQVGTLIHRTPPPTTRIVTGHLSSSKRRPATSLLRLAPTTKLFASQPAGSGDQEPTTLQRLEPFANRQSVRSKPPSKHARLERDLTAHKSRGWPGRCRAHRT